MITNDSVSLHLDVIARWLESNGYAIDVDYTSACIVVWVDNWPIVLEIKRQISKGKGQKEKAAPPDQEQNQKKK